MGEGGLFTCNLTQRLRASQKTTTMPCLDHLKKVSDECYEKSARHPQARPKDKIQRVTITSNDDQLDLKEFTMKELLTENLFEKIRKKKQLEGALQMAFKLAKHTPNLVRGRSLDDMHKEEIHDD